MATGSSAISGLPEGYTLEQPSAPPQQNTVPGLPAGYTLEKDNTPSTQGAFTPDADNISTGGEGSNSDQQLMSDASQSDATKKGLIIGGAGAAAVGGLAASPLIAAGTAEGALINAGGAPLEAGAKTVLGHLAKTYGVPAMNAIKEAAEAHPIVAELLKDGLKGWGLLKVGEYLTKLNGGSN